MTNHIHLLATSEFDDSISKVFQSVARKYVQYFNYTYKRSGTLWEGRYRAAVVVRYIALNPVRADMVGIHGTIRGRATPSTRKAKPARIRTG